MNHQKNESNQILIVEDKTLYYRQELKISESNRKLFDTRQNLTSGSLLDIGDGWYEVINNEFSKPLIKLFSNDLVKEILVALMHEPLTIPQMSRICRSPQTSTYRKINLLLKYGVLREKDYMLTKSGLRIHSYYSILRGMRIELGERMSLFVKLHFSGK